MEEKNIIGTVCSDNKDSMNNLVDFERSSFYANCETKPMAESALAAEFNIYVRVHCPIGCKDMLEFEVYGDGPFADHSSLCRTAIHTGVIADSEGGFFVLAYDEDRFHYVAGS